MVKYDIPNFSNYFLGEDLQVYNKTTERILEGNVNNNGYVKITMINDDGDKTAHGLHYIIAICCIPKPVLIVNHIDNNPMNNKISNLEWVTPSENRKHAFRHNLILPTRKKVVQLEINGNHIREFGSVKEAKENTGIGHVAQCCRGELKTSGGYKWKYL